MKFGRLCRLFPYFAGFCRIRYPACVRLNEHVLFRSFFFFSLTEWLTSKFLRGCLPPVINGQEFQKKSFVLIVLQHSLSVFFPRYCILRMNLA